MIYYFSKNSKLILEECHVTLRNVFNRVIRTYDCSIIEGYRNETKQNQFFNQGLSKLKFPDSLHNQKPSLAVHCVPYFADRKVHIDWFDREAFIHLAGIVKGVASQMPEKPTIRWGGDWDRDNDLKNNNFDDLAHYELIL